MTFGERLRRARERAGLSVYALAQLVGMSQSAVAALEGGGRDPRLGTAQALARALGVGLLELAGPDPEPGPPPEPLKMGRPRNA